MKHLIGREVILLEGNAFNGERGTIKSFGKNNMIVELKIGIDVSVGFNEDFFLIDSVTKIKTNPNLN